MPAVKLSPMCYREQLRASKLAQAAARAQTC